MVARALCELHPSQGPLRLGRPPKPHRSGEPCGPADGFEPGISSSGVRCTTAGLRDLVSKGGEAGSKRVMS